MIPLPQPATVADLQRYIDALEREKGWDADDLVRSLFRMGEEVGELHKAVRRVDELPTGAPIPDRLRVEAAFEIVDVLNYLLAIANRLDVDLEEAFRQKNAHNEARAWPERPSPRRG